MKFADALPGDRFKLSWDPSDLNKTFTKRKGRSQFPHIATDELDYEWVINPLAEIRLEDK